ncbi:MAG TPA: MFS transporter [Alphaproteobacteria bacterium]|nr:MFS transporter [Alphaproteobacteria bacterium]
MTDVESSAAMARRRALAAVIGTAFGVGISIGAVVPLLALNLELRGYDAAAIGANAAMFPIGAVASSFLVPRIIARLGLFAAILLSITLCAAGMLLFPLLDDYYAWCAIRLFIGCVGVIHWIASETWINLLARDASRSRVMAVYATVMAGGFVGGPLLLSLTGIDGWLPFAAVAAASLCALIPVLLIRSAPPAMGEKLEFSLPQIMRAVPMVMAAALVAGFVDASLFALIPVHQVRAGIDTQVAVLSLSVFMAGNLALQYPLGWIADHTSRRGAALGTAAVIVAGAAAYPFLLSGLGAGFWAMMFVWGGVSWGMYTLGLALLGERFPSSQLAAANAAFVMVYEMGSIAGPVASGAALDRWPVYGLPCAVGVVAAAFIAVAMWRPARA